VTEVLRVIFRKGKREWSYYKFFVFVATVMGEKWSILF